VGVPGKGLQTSLGWSKSAILIYFGLEIFTTYVRPYVVWNSLLVKDINALEAVQRRFTKRITGMKNLTYYQRLRALGIESLELRRLRADLLFTYKFCIWSFRCECLRVLYNTV